MGQKKPVFCHNLHRDDFRYVKINPDESAPENHSEIGHDITMKENVFLKNDCEEIINQTCSVR